jgi:hypothetical protein
VTTKPLPAHGERARYLRGCRCTPCTNAAYRYMSRYRYDREHGRMRRIDATPTVQHIQALLDNGWTRTQIAAASGRNHAVIGDLADGRQQNLTPDTARAIQAVNGAPPRRRDVDATGTIRRIRALYAIGHTLPQIAAHVGINHNHVGNIARGKWTTVRATTADAVANAYRHMARSAGPSLRARTIATRNGWHGPLAWDDIDDPAALPEIDGVTRTHRAKKRDTADAITAEVQHLANCGESTYFIAQKLGRSEARISELLPHHLKEAA